MSSARGCSLLAVCVNLSRLFKNKLGPIFFHGLVFWFFLRILKLHFTRKSTKPQENGNPECVSESNALPVCTAIVTDT